MRKAWAILMRAIRDIIDNPVPALQVSVLPILIVTFVGEYWLTRAVAAQSGFLLIPGRFVWWMWALALAATFVPLLWLAVGWHRFVLLGERPWLLAPRLLPTRILAYGGRSLVALLLAGLLATVIVVIVTFILGVGVALVGNGETDGRALYEQVGAITGGFFGAYFFLLLSPGLVATACGKHRRITEAVFLGRWQTGPAFWLTVASFGIVWVWNAIVALLDLTGVVLDGYVLVSNWFLILFNVGLLTAYLAETEWGAEPHPLSPVQEPGTPAA